MGMSRLCEGLGDFERRCQSLGALRCLGRPWDARKGFGSLRKVSGCFLRPWNALGCFVRVCKALEGLGTSGKLHEGLGGFGTVWVAFGKLWKALEGFSVNIVALFPLPGSWIPQV